MFASKLLVAFVLTCVLLQFVTEIHAACVCNEKGTDYCRKCDERVIVRPKPRYHDPDIKLPPIGDSCWCSKLMIEPAALPKPCAKPKKPKCGCKYGPPVPTYAVPDIPYAASKPKDGSPPADPISVNLAIQHGKAIAVPEAKLAYGFVRKPIDGLKKIYFSDVPEENLFKLNNAVITLKRRPQIPKPDEEDEELLADEYDEAAAGYEGVDDKPQLTYKQLGYVAEEFKNPKFREVTTSYGYEEEPKPVYGRVAVDCGFKPGRVSPYKNKPYAKDCY